MGSYASKTFRNVVASQFFLSAPLYRHWGSAPAVWPIGGSRGIALLFHDQGTRRWWGVSVKPRPLFTPRKDPVSILQEAGWVSEPVWIGAGNLASTGIRSPDRPARSQSLYRLRYPAHSQFCYLVYLTTLAKVVIASNSTIMNWKWRRLLALNITYKTHSKFLSDREEPSVLFLWQHRPRFKAYIEMIQTFVNNQLDAFFFVYVYFCSLHVSGSHVPITRRTDYINTTSGICHSVYMTVWCAGLHENHPNSYKPAH
jgi:hypothetical protein